MPAIYIGMGANLGDPLLTLQQAAAALGQHPELHQVRCSSFYSSSPMGPADQPDYVNAVVAAESSLPPHDVLDLLQQIEQQFGRVRLRHWGERTLDLDLLLYGNDIIRTERLTVPHPGLTERDFVILPLAELAPDLKLPDGQTLDTLAAAVKTAPSAHDLQKIT
ncbi:2-amino-4-hydroxy-6-hydroxymethyldihydropteridine diphosphokinase [Pseudidiomarina sp.]|uniref:2-amino-4-hydroxy-6- hydroxymethyldihydropteridine diphosphokinase n=1 Tax=Pseudidiomarina sp. TaxID=2081707 RepID=UPI00299DD032|nr:2-amino-4-hydroxy-6-hydroxymethyldihydropteridine diphosphokinase [Pseudidiomarina sp.]MDX1706447.1 2-amino-4-hydroxy-6-hydroxymethyldihydropteridine diphosphokinase [Pseudidiomarina sp.]